MERVSESTFLSVYGSPVLQAAVGIDPARQRTDAESRTRVRCICIWWKVESPS